jgi:hypothetical protein
MTRSGILGAAGVALAFVLAGCQPKPVVLVKQDPGSWSASFTLDSFDVPNAPPSYRADLEKALADRSANAVCISPEQAARSDLVSELVRGQGLKDCEFEENRVEGGKLMVEGVCADPKDRPVELLITGTADAKKADLAISMAGDEQADAPVMIKLRAVFANNGPCAAQPVAKPKAGKGK